MNKANTVTWEVRKDTPMSSKNNGQMQPHSGKRIMHEARAMFSCAVRCTEGTAITGAWATSPTARSQHIIITTFFKSVSCTQI
jgi:hypothetical protein